MSAPVSAVPIAAASRVSMPKTRARRHKRECPVTVGAADPATRGVLPDQVEHEQVLRDDRVAVEPRNVGDVIDPERVAAPARRPDHAIEKPLLVADADAGIRELAGHLDRHNSGPGHHHRGDPVPREQSLERTGAEYVIADVLEQILLLGDRHRHVLDHDDVVREIADFLALGFGVERGDLGGVDRVDECAENRVLGRGMGIRAPRFGNG